MQSFNHTANNLLIKHIKSKNLNLLLKSPVKIGVRYFTVTKKLHHDALQVVTIGSFIIRKRISLLDQNLSKKKKEIITYSKISENRTLILMNNRDIKNNK